MLGFVDELELANNAYRTEKYIVTQQIAFEKSEMAGSRLTSDEVFYERNRERDLVFEKVFANRTNINGKRLRVTMYSRRYVN